jgi:hypothetical protein
VLALRASVIQSVPKPWVDVGSIATIFFFPPEILFFIEAK